MAGALPAIGARRRSLRHRRGQHHGEPRTCRTTAATPPSHSSRRATSASLSSWTRPPCGGPPRRAAEDAAINAWLFHQDRDRLSFLKFFCYLTDVGPHNGPHTVVRGTQREVPKALATDGRKDDDLVRSAGIWDRGRGAHRPGRHVHGGRHRRAAQGPATGRRATVACSRWSSATSLFGAPVDYPVFTPSEQSLSRYREMPRDPAAMERSITPE